MYIKSINIQNFKCFENQKIELDPNFNLIIGENNSGKSTLFEALRLWQLAIQQFYTARTQKLTDNIGFYKRYSYQPLEISDLTFLRIQDIKDVFHKQDKPFIIEICFSNGDLDSNIPISFKLTSRDSLNCKIGYDLSGSEKSDENNLREISNNLFKVMNIANNDTFRNRIRLAYIPPKFNLPNKEILLSDKNEFIVENLILGKSQLVIRNILHPWCKLNYRRKTKKAKISQLKLDLKAVVDESIFVEKYKTIIKPYIENVLKEKITQNKNKKNKSLENVENGLANILDQKFNFKSYQEPTKYSSLSIKNSLDSIEISQLGSGTINVLNILSVLEYNNQTIDKAATKSNLLLLDEPDSHLHSNLQKELFSHLEKQSQDQDTQIFIITHNSSLISQFDRVLFIEKNPEIIKPITISDYLENHLINMDYNQYEIIKKLNDTKKEQEQLKTELDKLQNINIPILYVEGATDKIILECAYKKLFSCVSLPFNIINGRCANQLKSIFENENTFTKNEGISQIALFDFDDAYNQWNGIKHFQQIEDDPFKSLVKKHQLYKGYALLLPVPDSDIKKQVIKNDYDTFKHKSILTIEHLFYGVESLNKYFNHGTAPGGAVIIEFRGNKMSFANETANLSKEDFKHFIPLFKQMKAIIDEPNN